jgi:DNA-binding protein H-NS
MAKINLSRMDFQSLVDLRKQVEQALVSHRTILERQLASLGGSLPSVVRRGGSSLRGTKVAPKYRGPGGETWAGRGAKPRWLAAAIKEGKKVQDFLIDKTGVKPKRKVKRAKRKSKS